MIYDYNGISERDTKSMFIFARFKLEITRSYYHVFIISTRCSMIVILLLTDNMKLVYSNAFQT